MKKNDAQTSALRSGFIGAFDASMKGEEHKTSLKDQLFSLTSSEFRHYNQMGVFLGKTFSENLQLAIRRRELNQFIVKEMSYKKPHRKLEEKSR